MKTTRCGRLLKQIRVELGISRTEFVNKYGGSLARNEITDEEDDVNISEESLIGIENKGTRVKRGHIKVLDKKGFFKTVNHDLLKDGAPKYPHLKEEMFELCRRDRVEKEEAEEREEAAKDAAHRTPQEPVQEMVAQLPAPEPAAPKPRRVHIKRSTGLALVLVVAVVGAVYAAIIYVGRVSTAPTQQNILFEDEFDGKIDDRWIALYDEDHILVTKEVDGVEVHEVKMVLDGYKPFKVENGRLTSANAQWTPTMAVGEADWSNYSVEMDVTEHKGCSVVVLMRCAVDRYGNYRGVMFLAGRYLDLAGWWTCESIGGRSGGTGWNPISVAPRVRSESYHLRVDAIGNEFSAYIDGKLWSRVTIDGYPSGRAGVGFGVLSTYYDAPCPVYVSYFRVKALD